MSIYLYSAIELVLWLMELVWRNWNSVHRKASNSTGLLCALLVA